MLQTKNLNTNTIRKIKEYSMKCNVGGFDRIARIVVGLALVAFAFFGNQPWAYLGIIPLVTGLFKFCPLYPIFGISSACNSKDGSCDTKS